MGQEVMETVNRMVRSMLRNVMFNYSLKQNEEDNRTPLRLSSKDINDAASFKCKGDVLYYSCIKLICVGSGQEC